MSNNGHKYNVPENISGKCFKRIITAAGGYTDVIQRFIDLISEEIEMRIKVDRRSINNGYKESIY